MHAAAEPAPLPLPARRSHAPWIVALVVLAVALLVVAGAWSQLREHGMRRARATFEAETALAIERMRQQVLGYELLVRGVAALPGMGTGEGGEGWQRQATGLDLPTRFPEVQALGIARSVVPGEPAAAPPDHASLPTFAENDGSRQDATAMVVQALLPGRARARLAGLDLSSDPRRREALEQAAASGTPKVSLPVPSLGTVAGAERPDAFALVVPVQAGASGSSGSPGALAGWAFAQVGIAPFVQRALAGVPEADGVSIDDVTGGNAVPVYRRVRSDNRAPPAFTRRVVVELPGRRWSVAFASVPRADLQGAIGGLRATLVGGTLGALVLAALAWALLHTRARVAGRAARMAEASRRSEQRFRGAMEYSAVGKALLDRGGRITDANPALAQLLGTTREALVGSLFGEHFADDESTRTVERNVLSGSRFRTTRRLRRSDGDVRHASLVFATVPGESGDEPASLVEVEDATERLRAEAQVQSLNRTLEARVALRTRELRQASEELEAFSYGVSHDLRAPLRAIDGFARLLGERYQHAIDDNGRDYLARIHAATARMGELIDALLQVSRVSRGELRHEPVDLSRMAQDIATDQRNADPARDVVVSVAPGMEAVGDPGLLRTLLENLLDNAWKFTRGRERARIEVGRQADAFFVRDNGAGFPQAQAGRLFRPFQRLHGEQEFPGHGIGLASAKRIVERHGGSVRAEGVEGSGATFWFTLPAGEGEPDARKARD